ncbi:MAG: hypothetical protein IIB55_10030 [Planctomycetes bacterium]|nr:hypothetical protein [Planctomycetota bacterium]
MNSLTTYFRVTFAALVAAVGTAASAQTVPLRVVAVSGTPAPGLAAGTTFDGFDSPRLNEGGDVAFWVRLAGPGIDETNDGSIWTDRAGSLAIVYREDDSAPFGADIRFAALPLPAFNDGGSLAFTAGLYDNSGPLLQEPWLGAFKEDALFNIFAVAREGSVLPGLTGNAASLPVFPFNNAGDIAFSVSEETAGVVLRGAAVYSTRGGLLNLTLLARSGTPATGTATGLETVFLTTPTQNEAGVVAYRAAALDPAVVVPDDIVLTLWRDAGTAELVAWTNPAAPPLGKTYFGDLSQTPRLSHDGRVTFWASRVGNLVAPENDGGLWRFAGGVNTLLVQEGDAAPGTGATFKRIPRQFAHTAFGRIAFTASLRGAGITIDDNSGIWTNAFTGSLELLVREGDAVAGLVDVNFGILSDPYMNHAGQIAFTAHLRGAGVGPDATLGFFATDQTGRIHLIARMGDTIVLNTPVNPERVVREITFTHDRGTGRSQFAADGRLIFSVIFVDWSSAIMEARVGCRADVNGDGVLDIFDFLGFQNYFVSGDPRGDFVPDARFDIFDFLAFQNEFVAGCP